MVPTTATAARPDATCAAAVELAAEAARAEGAAERPVHLGVRAEGDRVVTHFFAASLAGYAGWQWAVTVARAPRSKLVTVDEVVLLPGDEALLAPQWVPWSERLRPGDLGVGDLVPTAADDDRLAPAYLLSDDPAVESVAFELGLGRPRVMSKLGRDDAADRWYSGAGGPDTPMAAQAPGKCGGCGFFLPIQGSLGLLFGVCGNALSPRDASVVSADAGCGAHSEALVEPPPLLSPPTGPAYDDGDDIEHHTRAASADAAAVAGSSTAEPTGAILTVEDSSDSEPPVGAGVPVVVDVPAGAEVPVVVEDIGAVEAPVGPAADGGAGVPVVVDVPAGAEVPVVVDEIGAVEAGPGAEAPVAALPVVVEDIGGAGTGAEVPVVVDVPAAAETPVVVDDISAAEAPTGGAPAGGAPTGEAPTGEAPTGEAAETSPVAAVQIAAGAEATGIVDPPGEPVGGAGPGVG